MPLSMDMNCLHVSWLPRERRFSQFVPAKQHLVPKTGKTTAVPCDAVIRIVTVQLLAELSMLLGNGLMPVQPAPKLHGP